MRIAIRVDASERIGGGHVMRCLTLADALAAEGAEIVFVSAGLTDFLTGRIAEAGHALRMIEPPRKPEADRTGWEASPLSAEQQQADAHRTSEVLSDAAPNWVVVDQYRLDHRWESDVRQLGAKILVIDDLANRRHDCEMLLDQTVGRPADAYRPLVPAQAKLMVGAEYALLRSEFETARRDALKRRRSEPGNRLLLSFGSTDIGGLTASVLDALIESGCEAQIDVVFGSDTAPSFARATELAGRHANIALHYRPDSMSELMTGADLAVGTAGSTSWERCCLGLPSVTLVVADNQRAVADHLEQLGAAVTAADGAEAAALARDLIGTVPRLREMSAAAAAIVDGRGAGRVAAALLGGAAPEAGALSLRAATEDDCERLWLWRNDPLVRRMAKVHAPIAWPGHEVWYRRALTSGDIVLFVGEVGGSPVGMVRFDRNADGSRTVSINLDPHRRGQGIGAKLLAAACNAFTADHHGIELRAEIDRDNAASQRIFERNGFASPAGQEEAQYRTFVRLVGAGQASG